jgi:hypothetical protein
MLCEVIHYVELHHKMLFFSGASAQITQHNFEFTLGRMFEIIAGFPVKLGKKRNVAKIPLSMFGILCEVKQ